MMLPFCFTIQGRLPDFNEIVAVTKQHWGGYSNMKRKFTNHCAQSIIAAGRVKFTDPIAIHMDWFVKDKRRDPDNVFVGTKFILDALVTMEVIENDSMKWVKAISNTVSHDPKNPRVNVTVTPLVSPATSSPR